MDDLVNQGLKLATLEPPLTKPVQELFGSVAAESLSAADLTWAGNSLGDLTTQAALTGETQLGRDTIAATTSTRSNISAGDSITGFINSRRDHDWFKIQLTAGITYRFNLNRQSGQVDPLLGLRSSTGTLLTSNDDSDGTLNSAITYTAASSGTHPHWCRRRCHCLRTRCRRFWTAHNSCHAS